jgi:hypothetical protein
MMVPSTEVTVLIGFTFSRLCSDKLKILKKLSGSWVVRTAAFAHFEVRVESLGASFHFTN